MVLRLAVVDPDLSEKNDGVMRGRRADKAMIWKSAEHMRCKDNHEPQEEVQTIAQNLKRLHRRQRAWKELHTKKFPDGRGEDLDVKAKLPTTTTVIEEISPTTVATESDLYRATGSDIDEPADMLEFFKYCELDGVSP